jgi:hypothetical protein
MRIGIIGARLAGSYAGMLLARMGQEVLLFDDCVEKEKPCGGGVTSKVLRKMPWLQRQPLPHSKVATIRLTTHDGYISNLSLSHPIHVYPRPTLDSYLRQMAIQAGVRFVPQRARRFNCDTSHWAIETSSEVFEVDFLIGADGATSSVRASLLKPYSAADLTLAIGYKMPELVDPDTILIGYQEKGFLGYIWSFPCVDHASIGIGQWLPGARSSDLRRRLDEFVYIHYPNAGTAGKDGPSWETPPDSRMVLRQKVSTTPFDPPSFLRNRSAKRHPRHMNLPGGQNSCKTWEPLRHGEIGSIAAQSSPRLLSVDPCSPSDIVPLFSVCSTISFVEASPTKRCCGTWSFAAPKSLPRLSATSLQFTIDDLRLTIKNANGFQSQIVNQLTAFCPESWSQ